MEYNSKFTELAREIARMRAEGSMTHPQLAEIVLAQAIIESGRGTSTLAQKHNNFFGMKYRKELAGLADKEYVKVTSEASGGDYFCSFKSVRDGIEGYWKFVGRSPYDGWENNAESGEDYIRFIGPIWCPPGQTEEYKKKHYGLTYEDYIIEKLLPEARALLENTEYKTPEQRATWFEMTRNSKGDTVTLAVDGQGVVVALLTSNVRSIINDFQNQFPNARTVRIAPAGKAIPHLPEYTRGKEPPMAKQPVLIDPGHSERHPGAKSRYNPDIQEEDLNRAQANLLHKVWSAGSVIAPEIYDPMDDDLEEIGYRAEGKAAFISLHHNSAERITREPGVEVLIDNDKGSKVSEELAQLLVDAIAKNLGIPNRGVKRQALMVLDRAERVCDGPCVLVETNFINIAKDLDKQMETSIKAAQVIAEVVETWLRSRTKA